MISWRGLFQHGYRSTEHLRAALALLERKAAFKARSVRSGDTGMAAKGQPPTLMSRLNVSTGWKLVELSQAQ